ncbi:hypothetical protein Sbs19_20070 [Sphingobium sp. BS19]|nr:hypothetical protein Sbs19_20070 [Sphingobium sp. BS19]
MAGGTNASITLLVEIFDPQAMWDHALGIFAGASLPYKIHDQADPTRVGDELHDGFVAMCGSRDDPDICECLRQIFDPVECPPGVQIDDSTAELAPPTCDEKYPHFIGDRGELGVDGFGAGHE